MSNGNRIKETTTATNLATITLAGAVSGFRPFLYLVAGVKRTGLKVRIGPDANGAWLIGAYDLTADNTLTRRAILDSSANGADVTLAAGVKEVDQTLVAAQADRIDSGTSTRVVFTSSVAVGDANLAVGSTNYGTDTDATTKINALLAQGGIVVVDGAYGLSATSSTTSLRIPGNTTMQVLPGCGFIMRPEQLVPMIRNMNPIVVPANIIDENIRIEGGIWNANGANQSVRETVANGGIFALDFFGVRNLSVGGRIQILQTKAFACHGACIFKATIDEFTIDPGADAAINTDGVHFNGPFKDIRVTRGTIRNCFDDCIAFNVDDAFNAGGNYGPYVCWGDGSGVHVDDIWLEAKSTGVRLLSAGSRLDQVYIGNIQGTSSGYVIIANNFVPSQMLATGPGNMGSIVIENINVKTSAGPYEIKAMMSFGCKIDRVTIKDFHRSKFDNVAYPSIEWESGCDIGQMSVSGYKSAPNDGGTYLVGQFKMKSGAKVGQLKLNDNMFNSNSNISGSPIEIDSGATITQLSGSGNSGMGFTSLMQNNGTVTYDRFSTLTNFMDGVASMWAFQANTPWSEGPPNTLTYTGPFPGVVASAKRTTNDAFGGNVKFSSRVTFLTGVGTNLHGALFVRGSNSVPWSGAQSLYNVDINMVLSPPQIRLYKKVAGQDSPISAAISTPMVINAGYDFSLVAKDSTISVTVQRVSDGYYMQTNGSFAAAAATVISVTDTSVPAVSGELGFYGFADDEVNHTSPGVRYENITVTAAP